MVVETGIGLSDATSYVDIVYADSYFSARGIKEWEVLADEEKETALVRATDFIDATFEWYGKRLTEEQGLMFPRSNLFTYDGYEVKGIPNCLKMAVCEASLISSKGTELFLTMSENGAVTSERIGDLSFSYDVANKQKDVTLYDSINHRLRGLYKEKGRKRIYAIPVKRVI